MFIYESHQIERMLTSEFFWLSGYGEEDQAVSYDHQRQRQEELNNHAEYVVKLLVGRTRISEDVHTLVKVFFKGTSVDAKQQSLCRNRGRYTVHIDYAKGWQ